MVVATSLGLCPKPLFALVLPTSSAKQERKEDSREPDGPRNPRLGRRCNRHGDTAAQGKVAVMWASIRAHVVAIARDAISDCRASYAPLSISVEALGGHAVEVALGITVWGMLSKPKLPVNRYNDEINIVWL